MVLLYQWSDERADDGVHKMIRETSGGWKVVSHSGKNLSGVLKSLAEAEKRLAQVEMFKHMKGK